MEYYSAIKKNEILPFATTIFSEVRQRQILLDITYMQNLKNNTHESIYKTEIDSQTQKTNLWLSKGKASGGGINQEYGISRYKLLYIKIDKQQEFTIQHRELIQYLVIMENNLKYIYI